MITGGSGDSRDAVGGAPLLPEAFVCYEHADVDLSEQVCAGISSGPGPIVAFLRRPRRLRSRPRREVAKPRSIAVRCKGTDPPHLVVFDDVTEQLCPPPTLQGRTDAKG